jgi:hypothetical protein
MVFKNPELMDGPKQPFHPIGSRGKNGTSFVPPNPKPQAVLS